MIVIKNTAVSLLKAPLIQPFRVATGEHLSLENVLFTLELEDGWKGFGEAAIATHITGETAAGTVSNLKSLGQDWVGRDIADYLRLSSELQERFPHNKSAVAAVETALLDALTRRMGIPLWKFFGDHPRRLTTDITIVIGDLSETEESVRRYYKMGFRTFKVKVGKDEDLDLKRVLAVRKLAPRCPIYMDSNQGFTAEQTLRFLQGLKRRGVQPAVMEQPVPRADWEGLKKVTREAGVLVIADESVADLSQAIRLIREKAAHAINIKLMKFGFIQAREIARLAQANSIKLMIGGMMESSLAMTAAAHLAAGMGGFDYIDLDTPFFIKDGLKNNPYLSPRGIYDLKKVKAGIGIQP